MDPVLVPWLAIASLKLPSGNRSLFSNRWWSVVLICTVVSCHCGIIFYQFQPDWICAYICPVIIWFLYCTSVLLFYKCYCTGRAITMLLFQCYIIVRIIIEIDSCICPCICRSCTCQFEYKCQICSVCPSGNGFTRTLLGV